MVRTLVIEQVQSNTRAWSAMASKRGEAAVVRLLGVRDS
jgi:hypothetical protein